MTPAAAAPWHTPNGADAALSKTFGHLRLEDVLFGLNEACRRWPGGHIRSELPALKGSEPGNPIMYWIAAEAARHALWYCVQPSLESRIVLQLSGNYEGWKTIERLIDLAVDVQLHVPVEPLSKWEQTLSATIWGAVGQIFLPQYMLQRWSPYRVGQAVLMYGEAPRRRKQRDPSFRLDLFDAAVQRVLGARLEQFLFVLLQAGGRASSDRPALSHTTLAPVGDRRYDKIAGDAMPDGMYRSAYDGLFHALSATPQTMMEWSRNQVHELDPAADDLMIRFAGPNPLLRYPLVQCYPDKTDHCLVPVPHLMQEWLYEQLMDLLVCELGTRANLGQNLCAAVFEEYVGLLADKCSPLGPGWLHESDLRPTRQGWKVVDWARLVGGQAILLDAKRSFVKPSARGRWEAADWAVLKGAIIRGVKQACSFWSAVKAGHVPPLRGTSAAPVALIVMHGDSAFYNATDEWRAEVDAAITAEGLPYRVPWTVASLDTYENLMTNWLTKGESWLAETLMKAALEPSNKAFRDLPAARAEGPLWGALSTFLQQHVARFDPELVEQMAALDEPLDE